MAPKCLVNWAAAALVMLAPVSPSDEPAAAECSHWVAPAPQGSDGNAGTRAAPWATLQHAAAAVPDNTCTVWFENGLYSGANDLDRRFATRTTFKAITPYRAIFEHNGPAVELSGARNMVFDGFEFRHASPAATALVIYISRDADLWAENIVFRNNIIHDSYNNDLVKLHNGARFVTFEHNVFYNQGPSEQHIDINSVTDITIQDNIFFNDFAGSGRAGHGNAKSFLVIKDSNQNADGLEGSERITVRRNIFMNWEGDKEPFVQIGNDGKAYHEAEGVRLENNLAIGNALNQMRAAFGVNGAKDITFANNTVVGDLPASAYAFRVGLKNLNPLNQNIAFYNNIWSDPTRTMGAELAGGENEFSDGNPAHVTNLSLDRNLYWNGGAAVPPGDLVSPLVHDARRIVADPQLNADHAGAVLPRWNGSAFLSGNQSVRQEFERLVARYGAVPPGSPVIGKADPTRAPPEDILGRPRTAKPELGAFEHRIALSGSAGSDALWLNWTDPDEPEATSLAITYTNGTTTTVATGILTTTRLYTVTDVLPSTIYTVTLTARDAANAVLSESNQLVLLTADEYLCLPYIANNTP